MSVHPAAARGGGLIQDEFDPRDHYYVAQATTHPPASMNLREKFAAYTSEPYDQLQLGSCTANAAAAAFWYEEKTGRHPQVGSKAGPSRLFIYWLAREGSDIKNINPDLIDPEGGSNMREAMKGLFMYGACAEDLWPYSEDASIRNAKPSPAAFTDAKPHKITAFYRLDPDRPDENDKTLTEDQKNKIGSKLLENLKKCLAEGFPAAFGFWYYLPGETMFDQTHTPYVLKDIWNMPGSKFPRHTFPQDLPEELKLRDSKGNQVTPGHSVLAIGYDDGKQAVLVQNSWGKDWSGHGTFWMPYAWITDFAASNDFWTIRTTAIAADHAPKRYREVHEEILG